MVPSRGAVLGGPRHAGVRLSTARLPDPALVVLVGASGSGKSTWAAERYRREEIVSSDALRGVVGSGPHDLDASADAFALLETIVAARLGRGLCTVVDTLGTDPARRLAWLAAGRAAGLPTVAVLLATPEAECRRRNAARDRPVPAPVLAGQLRAVRDVETALADEGWDVVHAVSSTARRGAPADRAPAGGGDRSPYVHGGGGGAPGLALPVGRGAGDLAAGGGRGRRQRPASRVSR